MTDRARGRRKTDLSDEESSKVLKVAKSLIRTDFGGQDPDDQIRKKAEAEGLDLGPKTRAFIRTMCEDQVESCRKRVFPRIDEIIRRSEVAETRRASVESSP